MEDTMLNCATIETLGKQVWLSVSHHDEQKKLEELASQMKEHRDHCPVCHDNDVHHTLQVLKYP